MGQLPPKLPVTTRNSKFSNSKALGSGSSTQQQHATNQPVEAAKIKAGEVDLQQDTSTCATGNNGGDSIAGEEKHKKKIKMLSKMNNHSSGSMNQTETAKVEICLKNTRKLQAANSL